LSSQPVRSYLVIAAAIVIAGVLVSASLFVALQNEKTTVTVTCTGSAAGLDSASVTDCARGLTLGLSATPIIAEGSNQTVTVSVSNDLSAPSTVNYTSFPSLPHGLSMSNLEIVTYVLPSIPACGYSGSQAPALFMVLNASGYPMQLNDEPPSVSSCLSSGPLKSYTFTASETVTSEIAIGGYWTSNDTSEPWVNATYHHFSPGSYTLLAFDPWGQTVELSFAVDLSENGFASTSTSATSLQLQVRLNATTIRSGHAVSAQITIVNPLSQNVSVVPDYQADGSILSWNSYDFLCGGLSASNPTWSLAGYALFKGHYTSANLSAAGAPLSLEPPLLIECVSEPVPSSIVFYPNGSSIAAYFEPGQNGIPYPPVVMGHAAMNATTEAYVYESGYYGYGPGALFGYWVGPPGGVFGGQNATITSPNFHYFSPGEYTLAVEDMWGQVVYSYFEVTS
jgi:hypothetical protein